MVEEQRIIEALLKGDIDEVKKLVQQALDGGENPDRIMSNGLMAGTNIVGEKMEAEEMFIPEVLVSAKAMRAGIEILKPFLTDESASQPGKMVIGTVQGDLHDIGKNLVAMLMGGSGFSVIDLGVDVMPKKFVDAARENNADIVGISALLTTTMPKMKETIQALQEADLRGLVKVMVGGALVTEEFAEEIGADAYAPDAGSAVRIAKKLLQ